MDGNGQLVTKDGHPVLKSAGEGQDPASRTFQVTGEQQIAIAENGDIYEGDEIIGRLSVVDVANKSALHKIGNSLFDFKPNMQPEITNVQNPSVKQGFLEMSNVNVVQEMTDMISTTRMFESTASANDKGCFAVKALFRYAASDLFDRAHMAKINNENAMQAQNNNAYGAATQTIPAGNATVGGTPTIIPGRTNDMGGNRGGNSDLGV